MDQPTRIERTLFVLGLAVVLAILAGAAAATVAYKLGYKQAQTEAEVELAKKDKEVAEAKAQAAKGSDRKSNEPVPLVPSSLTVADLPVLEGLSSLSSGSQTLVLDVLNNTASTCEPCAVKGASIAACIKDRGQICTSMVSLGKRAIRMARQEKSKDEITAAVTYKEPWVQIDLGKAPSKGPANAPIQIAEFTDFQCPFCVKSQATLKAIEEKYGNKVRIAYFNYPLPMHKLAEPAARAAMAADKQGGFWKMHDHLFANVKEFSSEGVWARFATDLGLNASKLVEDMESKDVKDAMTRDAALASKVGVRSTPTFFVNGYRIKGAQPAENFFRIIDLELADLEAR